MAGKKLQLGEPLPQHQVDRLKRLMEQRTRHVNDNRQEYPDLDVSEVEFTDTPADFVPSHAQSRRKPRRKKS